MKLKAKTPITLASHHCRESRFRDGGVTLAAIARNAGGLDAPRPDASLVTFATMGESNMTKKHFIALADTMKASKPTWTPGGSDVPALMQWERDVRALADFCASQNPRFNRTRWTLYVNGECGPNGGKI
jgi:hypothetical protein